MIKALINKMIPFSSVDGPGNRTSIFLQECNFNCLYCHNPETINKCINCGICVNECPYGALEIINGKVVWNKNICEKCDKCIEVCPNNSSPKTVIMTVEDVINEIKKTKSFISGVTISGGECTKQVEFLIELCKEVKNMGLTSFVDTNGSLPFYDNPELVEAMDMAMLDVKSFEVNEHKMLTGMDNEVVLKNLRYLAEINKMYEVRTVIVPEVLDNYNNVDEISKIIASINPDIRYKLIKYRAIGVRKEMIQSYSPSDDMMHDLSQIAIKNGCKNVIIV
jgi:pyruvate formate lyase activating enzyme